MHLPEQHEILDTWKYGARKLIALSFCDIPGWQEHAVNCSGNIVTGRLMPHVPQVILQQ